MAQLTTYQEQDNYYHIVVVRGIDGCDVAFAFTDSRGADFFTLLAADNDFHLMIKVKHLISTAAVSKTHGVDEWRWGEVSVEEALMSLLAVDGLVQSINHARMWRD